VALAPARTGSGLERGAPSAIVDTATPNARPVAPLSVTATRLSGGGVTLSWPAAADNDGTIRYYRIYRDDNSAYTKRVDRTGTGADLSWTDDSPGAADHTYWITAVDNKLAESSFAPSDGVSAP
jgi:fibronectin type 3 domain-containing protein